MFLCPLSLKEKHAKKPTANIDSYFTDRKTHLYTLGKDERMIYSSSPVCVSVILTSPSTAW